MKKTINVQLVRVLGIIALTALIGFSFAACGKDDPDPTPCTCPNGTVHTDKPCDCGGDSCVCTYNDDGDNDPQPVAQSKDITIGIGKTVTVNYTALPDTIPAWWNTLEAALKDREGGFAPGAFTLTVTSTGTDGFVAGTAGSGTATVSDDWLSKSDFSAMRLGIAGIVTDWGVAPTP